MKIFGAIDRITISSENVSFSTFRRTISSSKSWVLIFCLRSQISFSLAAHLSLSSSRGQFISSTSPWPAAWTSTCIRSPEWSTTTKKTLKQGVWTTQMKNNTYPVTLDILNHIGRTTFRQRNMILRKHLGF